MARITSAQQSFAGGELSRKLNARADLAIYYTGGSWFQNFIATTQGEAKFRSGSKFAWNTRGFQVATLVPFEFNTEQAYILEFTAKKMRIFRNGGIVTETAQDITTITQADPAVVTYSGADNYSNGDAVVLTDISGMSELNNQEYRVANVNTGANTFELTDQDGNNIDSTAFTAYSSGGSIAKIVEVDTPYLEAELFQIDYAQTADTMYITHPNHAPYKLTRSAHTSWTLQTFTITANPFADASQDITGITNADPGVVTYSGADNYANGDTVYLSEIVGMEELNGVKAVVANVDTGANTFELNDADGNNIDTTSYGTYSSGGKVHEYSAFPSVVTFFEQRLVYAATDDDPQKIWFSKSADYDNLTIGTGADDALAYTIASGKVNRIRWMVGTEDFLAIGTAGSEFKAQGGGENDAITPTNVSIKPVSFYGSAQVKPIRLDSHIMYIQRDALTERSFEFDAIQDGYTSINRTLTADGIFEARYGKTSGAKQQAYQSGSPSICWAVRNDGVLVALTFEPREQVTGWHRHYAGGTYTDGKLNKPEYEAVATIPQDQNPDQVYTVVTRTINGSMVRYVEYFADQPIIPQRNDYYTGQDNESDDKEAYLQDLWEAQKRLWFVDSGLAFDGTISQTMTLSSAAVGTGVTATGGGAFLTGTSADVGKEIWGKEGGRAVITAHSSTTVCTVEVTVAFPSVSIASGGWYLTASTFTGLEHLEGQTVSILADGGVVEGKTVSSGSVTLDEQHSYVIIGLPYIGIYQSNDLEIGGNNGPSVTKQKSLSQLGVKFLNSLGARFGTDLYKVTRPNYRSTADKTGRPPPLFTGSVLVDIRDTWEGEKYIYCLQEKPLPCNLQLFSPYVTVNDG